MLGNNSVHHRQCTKLLPPAYQAGHLPLPPSFKADGHVLCVARETQLSHSTWPTTPESRYSHGSGTALALLLLGVLLRPLVTLRAVTPIVTHFT